ncbi:MAG TPA: hypothetical protein VI612_04980 [Candidatus Nanoarchaeia archaeon]|nr:hypothetical protein [Candidatus Nanoarchaeia archaeon]
MEEPSSHDRREQEKLAREEAREQKEEAVELKQRRKNYIWIGLTALLLIAFAGGIGWLYTHKPDFYTDREIHWHALVDITICGEHRDLPLATGDEIAHGKAFKGTHLMHTHDDNIIHIEGQVKKKEDIAIGNFFDSIEVPLDKDRIFEYKNGDLCPDGKPGKLKMYVNDQPREDFRDYVPFSTEDPRKQIIKLVFEPEDS